MKIDFRSPRLVNLDATGGLSLDMEPYDYDNQLDPVTILFISASKIVQTRGGGLCPNVLLATFQTAHSGILPRRRRQYEHDNPVLAGSPGTPPCGRPGGQTVPALLFRAFGKRHGRLF